MRLVLALALLAGAAQAESPTVVAAELVLPTGRYDHAVLGDATEWGGLDLRVAPCAACAEPPAEITLRITLPATRVFEDVTARLADVDGRPGAEVVVVETDLDRGASLAVYGPEGKIAATPFIGTRHRWLAPAGIADFDGDGRTEIAYVDRPHLLGELVFVRLERDRLVEILRLPGLTNHRIGDAFISGGVRDCGAGPELVLAARDWTRRLAVSLRRSPPVIRDEGALARPGDLAPPAVALDCP